MFTKLTERVFYSAPNEETDRPTLGYVRGERHVMMIDAGNSAAHVAVYNAELAQLNLPLPDMVGLTHWHWDHTFGLAAVNAISFACRHTDDQLKEMQGWRWDDDAMQERERLGLDSAFCNRMIRLEYPDRDEIEIAVADVVFDDQLTVDLGGITCEMMRVAGPHTTDSTMYLVPEEGVLFVSDAPYPSHQLPDARAKVEAFAGLLQELDFQVAVIGHSEHLSKEGLLVELEEEQDDV